MPQTQRPLRTHVVIIDGTLSRLDDGNETNAGLLYKLLSERGPRKEQSLHYDRGVQGEGLRDLITVAAGLGINQSIRRSYAAIASRYSPGDKIMLFGYSRGAYAVRSLAGLIARVGLLTRSNATQRRVHRAFRYYEATKQSESARAFRDQYCHSDVPIEVLGVWDTVRALGLPYPILNRLAPMATEFHNHHLSPGTKNGFHALALDENRSSYDALPWEVEPDWAGHVEQAWFVGGHPDVGGHVVDFPKARGLGNISLAWMLERAERCGLILPDGWREEFPQNALAPMHGPYRGSARFFIARAPRVVGRCSSEYIHPTVAKRMEEIPGYNPRAIRDLTVRQTEMERPAPAAPRSPLPEG